MPRFVKALALLLSVLATTTASAEDFVQIESPVQQQVGPGKVMVQQFLWHQCVHCYNLEASVENWLTSDKPDFIVFERIPVTWSMDHVAHGSFYLAGKGLQAQGKMTDEQLDQLNDALFNLHFKQQLELVPQNTWPLFKAYGVTDAEQLMPLLTSDAAQFQLLRAQELVKAFKIANVPAFVVAGKYLVSLSTLKQHASPERLFEVINQLAASELPRPLITPWRY